MRVRIDCETPGASIEFGAIRGSFKTLETNTSSNENTYFSNPDITSVGLEALLVNRTYSGDNFFLLGDGGTSDNNDIRTAGKYYVAASATKAGFIESDKGYEGAYKTAVMYRQPNNNADIAHLTMEGSNISGGMPTISGFPVRNADPDLRFTKHAYNATQKDWYWQSWEIISDWYITSRYWSDTTCPTNWQQGSRNAEYGAGFFVYRILHY